jgi:chromosome segregation ATPase
MTKRKPEPDLIEQLLAAANEAKATIRELHEARRDARTVLAELDAKVTTVRAEVVEGINELSRREWQRAMDQINLEALGAGLKRSFDQWLDHLADAKKVLDELKAHEAKMAVQAAAADRLQAIVTKNVPR